ncbi:hypothetical protein SR39_13575 [Methylobacterium radiotolerans]|nr:hypothetical protein SR39_13575 [Methylobacterium radiotolerans]
MRARALEGATVPEIMREFGRPKSTVRHHCAGLLPARIFGPKRLLAILEIAERSTVSRSVLACDLGFANASSLGVTLTRARHARREAAQCA